ncbi:MAG: hypothetical protein PHH47_01345 [Gallionella sp.]|nr:hypothetical protein [Gallionella sp.]MDD4946118.1 hypothetical protein [Gallionella sp.]
MSTSVMKPATANMELAILSAEADSTSSSDFYIYLTERGLPDEIALRLMELLEKTKEIGGRVINVGKIVLCKIIEFVKAHPNLSIGIVLGAAIGSLAHLVPFLGNFLATITIPLGAFIGAIAGHQIDKAEQGKASGGGNLLLSVPQDMIEIAMAFFKLLSDIFNTLTSK